MAREEVCSICQNTNGEHKPKCSRKTPKEWRRITNHKAPAIAPGKEMMTMDEDFLTNLGLARRERDAAMRQREAAEAEAADYKQRWADAVGALNAVNEQREAAEAKVVSLEATLAQVDQGRRDAWRVADEQSRRVEAAEVDAFKLGSRLAEWIDRAHKSEAETRLLSERVLRLAQYYARNSADWSTVRVQCGEQPPFVFPGDDEIRNLFRRAEAAEAEIEAVNRYLDECYFNNSNEASAIPLVDRMAQALAALNDALSYTTGQRDGARAEVARLRLQLMGALRTLRHVLNNVPMNAQPREQLVMMIAELDETLS